MDNNKIPNTTGGLGTNQPNMQPPIQPIEQQIQQPMAQPAPQVAPTQLMANQYTSSGLTMPTDSGASNLKDKKKRNLVIGCIIGAVILIALIATLLIIFLGNGEKTVTCTTNATQMGVTISGETNVKIKNGGLLGGDMTINVDLKTMRDSYKEYEKEMVDAITEQYKDKCKEHCVFDYNYAEGDSVKYTMQYDEEGMDSVVYTYGIENMSAQEIADKMQETLEDSETTCVQR